MENCQKAASTTTASAIPKATNVNTLTVNLPSYPTQQNSSESSKALTLSPQPIQLSVESSTDWPTVMATSFVGITGAFVALAVGAMAYLGQRNQVRAATANFRHGWQIELRELIAKFIAVTSRIHYELEANPDYLNSSKSNIEYSTLIETRSKIELMLDRSKSYSKDISRRLEGLISAVKKQEIDRIFELSEELLEIANGVLEQTWQDIRNDLKGKQ